MRKITTAVTAAALALSMLTMAVPAAGAAGYDSAYAGESAFQNVTPGQTVSFQVFFANTGTQTWARGTATQVDLAACLNDKVTCNAQDPEDAPWNAGWLSATRYATTTQASVAPGSIATFSYSVTAPSNVQPGTYDFNGDLVVSATGEKIHPEGYYQNATVIGGGTAASMTLTPSFQFKQIGQNATLTITTLDSNGVAASNVAWTCNIATSPTVGGGQTFNPPLSFSGTTGSAGTSTLSYTRPNPGVDQVTCYVNANPIARANAQVQFGIAGAVLSVGPKTAETHAANGTDCRTYTVTVLDSQTGAGIAGQVVTITYAEDPEPAGLTPASGSTVTTGAGGVVTFNLCSTAAATASPKGSTTFAPGSSNCPGTTACTYTDTGGTTTFQVPTPTTATLSPSSATNFPSTSDASAKVIDNSPGEHRVQLSVKDQFGNTVATTSTGSSVYTVTATGGIVYILECGGVASTITVPAGGSNTCTSPAGTTIANDHITIDSSTPSASATIKSVWTPTSGTALTSNTATKSWTNLTASAEPTSGSYSGTVSFAEKRTCAGSSAANPAGFYILTVGSTSYLIAFDATNTYQIVGVVSTCDQFRAALSVGDVVVFTAGTGAAKTHNMTTNTP